MTQFEGHLKIKKGVYTLQFETTDYEKYKFMEKAAQKMMEQAKKEREGDKMIKRERLIELMFASLMERIGKSCNIDERFADHLRALVHLYCNDEEAIEEAEKALERSRG